MRKKVIKLHNLYLSYKEIKKDLFSDFKKIFKEMNLYLGPFQQMFEREFALYCDSKYFVSCSSGTDALHLALRAVGIKEKDEVILPSFTFFAVLEAVWMVGAWPVFALKLKRATLLLIQKM
ncbi:MAG: DegT/DnrJ/EryC1/StrS family aminotransferase [Candidatus Hydrothermales bacterium]